MSKLVETPNLEPLMRIMGLPPTLVRYLPTTGERPLRTMLLRDSPLVKQLPVEWADDCQLTFLDGQADKLAHVTISVPGGRKQVAGVHLALFGTKGQLSLVLGGDQLKVVVGSDSALRGSIHLAAKATAFIGDHTTAGQARFNVSNADLVVGDDCQLSEDVILQCSDQHAIIDLDSGRPVFGHRRHVRIGRHVWLGRRVIVMPDVTIGAGCIVEPGSVVGADVAANTLVGGAPAQVKRERVDWRR